jgi:hypothetical protein
MEQNRRYQVVGQIASAGAVALTLLFVGLQLRETSRQTALNTAALQVGAYQDLNAQISHFNELLLAPEIAIVWEHILDPDWNWPKFSLVERRQARSLMYMRIRHADMAFHQYERGMLTEERLTSALRPLLSDIDKPVVGAFWTEVAPNQLPAFRDYIDSKIAALGK